MAERAALITAYDKTDVPLLAETLNDLDFEIVSLGGTAELIEDFGVPVTQSRDFIEPHIRTEELDRYPNRTQRELIGAGIAQTLALPDFELEREGLPRIDVAYINLMPPELRGGTPDHFEGVTHDKGGLNMICAAIEGGRDILTSPSQIVWYSAQLKGEVDFASYSSARILGTEAAACVAEYMNEVSSIGSIAIGAAHRFV